MDKDVVRAGVAAGLEALQTASTQMERLIEAPDNRLLLEEVDLCLHRVGRMTAAMGLKEIAQTTREVEDALVRMRRTPEDVSMLEIELVAEAIELLSALLIHVDLRTGRSRTADKHGCLKRLRAVYA